MALKNTKKQVAYGLSQELINIPQHPIVSQRAPMTSDMAEIGTIWIDIPNDDSYILTSIVANVATWINAGGGSGIFNSLDVTTTAYIGTDLSVGGVVEIDSLDRGMLQSDDSGIISSINGTNGQVLIAATGADAAWATLTTDGSVAFTTGANTLGISVTGAAASTFPTDAGTATPVLGATTIAGGTNVNTSAAGATVTVDVDANPTFASGLTVSAGITSITANTNAPQEIYLHGTGGAAGTIEIYSQFGTGIDSVTLESAIGGISIESGLATDAGINLVANGGGIDADAALQINFTSSEAAIDAIRLNTSNAAGGIDIDSGTGGIAIDTTGAYSIDGAAASNLSVAGAGIDLTLASAAGRVVINAEEASPDAIRVVSAVGGIDLDVALQMNLTGTQAAASAIRMHASDAVGGIDIDAGTGGIAIDTTGGISLDAAAACNFTATGAFDVTVSSTAGSVTIAGDQAAVSDAVLISAGAADGGITLDAGATPGITITNGTQSAQLLVGTGSPDTAVTALQGSLFINVAGGASTILYVNTDGATAWSPLTA